MPLFLADENCDFSVVRALRSAGYDVLAVAEIAPQAPDHDVIDLAVRDGRILLTEDKDFGQLVCAELRRSSGVILIRFPASERDVLPATILDAVTELQDRLAGAFVVVTPNRIRIGRDPRV
jgi:predicted nuclease of predicted toxin-antitoxin system